MLGARGVVWTWRHKIQGVRLVWEVDKFFVRSLRAGKRHRMAYPNKPAIKLLSFPPTQLSPSLTPFPAVHSETFERRLTVLSERSLYVKIWVAPRDVRWDFKEAREASGLRIRTIRK